VQRFSVLKGFLKGAKNVPLENVEAVLGNIRELYIPQWAMPIYEEASDLIKILRVDLNTRIETIRTIAKNLRYDIVARDIDYIPSDRSRFPRTQIDVEHAVFLDEQGNMVEINKRWIRELVPIRLDLEALIARILFASKIDLKNEAGRPEQMPSTINVNVPPSPQPRKTQEVSGRV
jgi:hypothetical protein